MGSNLLSSTETVLQVIADMKPFVDMLLPQDRIIFSRFSEYASNNRSAIANAASLMPLEATLLLLLLEEHKHAQRLYTELGLEIDQLRISLSRSNNPGP